MANISVGGAHGGKRPVDADIPLVPFIDLLLCCVMFLLVTAVWSQLSQLEARGPTRPDPTAPAVTPDTGPTLMLSADAWRVSSGVGDRTEGPIDDVVALAHALAATRGVTSGERIAVAADDDVGYARVIASIDLAMGAGFRTVSMADSASDSW